MSELLERVLALLLGGTLGVIFFGGLWWTIRKGVSSRSPALWFTGSLLVRMSISLGGFYLIGKDHWQRMLICLVGFVTARLVVTWVTRQTPEISHAH